jgi:cytochrome P450
MATVAERPQLEEQAAPASPAGPVEPGTPLNPPPALNLPRPLQTAMFGLAPLKFNLRAQRELGDVWQVDLPAREGPLVMTSHPDHIKSLFTAKPQDAPTATNETPLRPILGPNSVLILLGERHMRERKLLLPPFHGEAVERYVATIRDVAHREIDRWPIGKPFSLAPRMQAVTLDVIMSGLFGIDGTPAKGTPEYRMRETFRRLLRISTNLLWGLVELYNLGREEARGPMAWVLKFADRELYRAIRTRRAQPLDDSATDVTSLLLAARDEHGQPLSDEEIRDELMTLVLAGHETTANSLAWTLERLVRTPDAYATLREAVRGGDPERSGAYVEATIHEGMRVRPVIPIIVRLVKKPWRLGEYVVPADTPIAISIAALHHRPDVYPDPFAFRPERFLDSKQPDDPGDELSGEPGRRAFVKPGTYTWIPFGGGIRRCLGASLAMAEQRVVLEAIARRTDLAATRPSSEWPRQRNVTMIPSKGGRVIVERKSSAAG